MKPGQDYPVTDLRGFRWRLAGVERRLENEVEGARLALARLQQQCRVLDAAEHRRATQRCAQEALALQSARRDVLAGARAMRYLASLEAHRVAAAAARAELEQSVAAARAACAERQRQCESVQTLRLAAQREHAQAQLRREWREADGAWLAFAQVRRAGGLRRAGERR
jgi:flagellar biosynthesis chaperone FliJ